jgi:hypothetical protein
MVIVGACALVRVFHSLMLVDATTQSMLASKYKTATPLCKYLQANAQQAEACVLCDTVTIKP